MASTGIDTSNILHPNAISLPWATEAIITDLQLLAPEFWSEFIEIYNLNGNEQFMLWLSTFAGKVEVKQDNYFWFEDRGKEVTAVKNRTTTAAAVNATVTLHITVGDHYDAGTESPLRVKQSFRLASTGVEGVILTIDKSVDNDHTFTARPKKLGTSLASVGSTSIAANEVLIFTGYVDAGEASDSIEPLIPLDVKRTNYTTELRETWAASDRAEMTRIYYDSGVSGTSLGARQAGTSYYTYKGLVRSERRFIMSQEQKLMFGDVQTNTGLTNSTGTQGVIAAIEERGETLTYTPGNLDIGFMHTLTRIMRVNGVAKQALWLSDVFQDQDFSDSLFAQFPAGAFVWGTGEKSEAASLAYGFRSINIDGFMLQKAIYGNFNTELATGYTPVSDRYRDFGLVIPMGNTTDTKTGEKLKNLSITYQQPPAGGTISNGIRVWEHGGGSRNPTNGLMVDYVEWLAYEGTRLAAGNQFLIVEAG